MELFNAVFERHGALMYMVDPASGTITAANAAARAFFGMPLAGASLFDLCVSERAEIEERLAKTLAAGSNKFTSRQRTGGGGERDLLFDVSIIDLEGTQSALAILHDITEQKRSEAELRKAKEEAEEATLLRDKFVSLVAHDLKSPFAVIMGLLHYIQNESEGLSDEHRALFGHIIESGNNLIKMIDDLLNINRLKTGKLVPRARFIDLQGLAIDIVGSLAPLARQKGIVLENLVPAGTLLYADRELLVEVLRNLLSNAIKFTGREGKVELFTPAGGHGALAVRDDGVGIKEDLLPHLFKPEEKTSTPGTAGELGTGFGLPLTMDIVKAHGGHIGVETAPGKGTLFTVTLPHVRPRILLADDDDILHVTVKAILKRQGWEMQSVYTAEDAMAAIETARPHLLLTDLGMPGGGMDLLAWLRHERRLNLPVIVVTADTDTATRERAFSLGADDFLTKPFYEQDIVPRAKKLLVSK